MKKLKYPRLTFGLFLFIILNLVFLFSDHQAITDEINKFGIWAFFILGSFYSFSFTTGLATGAFLSYIPDGNVLLYSFVGATGTVISELILFKIIRAELDGEIKKLEKSRLVYYLSFLPGAKNKYVLAFFGIILLPTPLPDELSIALLAENPVVKMRYFIPIALIMNTIGIFVLLSIIPEIQL